MADDREQDGSPGTRETPREEVPQPENLTDIWEDVRGPRPETVEERLVREHGTSHPGTLTLATSSGQVIVRISPLGEIAYGEGYTPNDAAEEFWTSLALKRVGMEQRLMHLNLMEQTLLRLGRADLRYEQAQLAARVPGAGDVEKEREELQRLNLETLVHSLLEYSRGLVARIPNPPPAGETPA